MPRTAQKLCESRGGLIGLPVPNRHYGLCGRKATFRAQELCESRGGRPGLPSLISPRFLWTYVKQHFNNSSKLKTLQPFCLLFCTGMLNDFYQNA